MTSRHVGGTDEVRLRDECLLGDLHVRREGAGKRCVLERDRDEEQIECKSSCDEGEDPESSLSER